MNKAAAAGVSRTGVRNDLEPSSVLMVGNFLSNAGASRGVCEDLALHLRAAGWRVRTTSTERRRLRKLARMLMSVWSLRREYAVSQVDVYSGPAFVWAAAVTSLLRLAQRPYVLTLHGGGLPEFSSRWPRVVQFVLGAAATVTVPSAYLQREMKPYRRDIVLLPNPLDLSAYSFRVRSNPRPKLIWLRAFHETYNPALALDALVILSHEFSDASLTMIGPDRGDGSLQKLIAAASRCGMAGRLTVVPGIPKAEVGHALSEGDIFINTTNVDNTPVSVMEAMACGLCVVSTNVGGVPDLVDDGRDGILVPASDPEAMAAAVRRVVADPSLAACLSANGRRKAENFDWSVVLPRWERILRVAANE